MTMSTAWVKDLEKAVTTRNPSLTARLQPGLPEARVKRALDRAKVTGDVAPLIALYTWRNGTDLSLASNVNSKQALDVEKAKMSFFPGKRCCFPSLEMAIGHFNVFKEIAKNYPKISEAVGRYFPVFWNGSTEELAIDLKPSNRSRVLIVDHRSDPAIREAYSSFEEFVADAIRVNEENKPLRCFQISQTT